MYAHFHGIFATDSGLCWKWRVGGHSTGGGGLRVHGPFAQFLRHAQPAPLSDRSALPSSDNCGLNSSILVIMDATTVRESSMTVEGCHERDIRVGDKEGPAHDQAGFPTART